MEQLVDPATAQTTNQRLQKSNAHITLRIIAAYARSLRMSLGDAQRERHHFMGHALELLRAGPFRRYIIGSLISDTGTWMQVMAQAWIMSTLTNKAIYLGLVNLFAGIPTILLTMHGGAAADRFDKRKILVGTQIWQIGLALIMGWLVLTQRIHIWHIMVTATLLGICIAFEMPAISALVPELVKHEQIARRHRHGPLGVSWLALDRPVARPACWSAVGAQRMPSLPMPLPSSR